MTTDSEALLDLRRAMGTLMRCADAFAGLDKTAAALKFQTDVEASMLTLAVQHSVEAVARVIVHLGGQTGDDGQISDDGPPVPGPTLNGYGGEF